MDACKGQDLIDWQYRKSAPDADLASHSHTKCELFYFHSGQADYWVGDNRYELRPGDMLIMQGTTLHRPDIIRQAPYVRTVLHFEPRIIRSLESKPETEDPWPEVLRPFYELQHCRLRLNARQQTEAELMLANMQRCYARGDFVGSSRFQLGMEDMLYWIYDLCGPYMLSVKDCSEPERHVQSIISYIERFYMEEITLNLLQDKLHLNKFYMSKLFKELTGKTIMKYLYTRRVNQAKVLFQEHRHLSVTDTCYSVGFKHASHFTKVFKQVAGTTPEHYRKHAHGR
ncbi:AraC family transcriptional regulator [Paenibacillus sp. FJAT-27812]|uniref:AraC family transcriptional regulator n=1 Tax=Paenibacillus sp. FJAT-27812 TaxID=1684143 RepID=UPI0006A78C78|nr:AraC family transcriptional regulator [Paenibacillus sp. FJAT-27812]